MRRPAEDPDPSHHHPQETAMLDRRLSTGVILAVPEGPYRLVRDRSHRDAQREFLHGGRGETRQSQMTADQARGGRRSARRALTPTG